MNTKERDPAQPTSYNTTRKMRALQSCTHHQHQLDEDSSMKKERNKRHVYAFVLISNLNAGLRMPLPIMKWSFSRLEVGRSSSMLLPWRVDSPSWSLFVTCQPDTLLSFSTASCYGPPPHPRCGVLPQEDSSTCQEGSQKFFSLAHYQWWEVVALLALIAFWWSWKWFCLVTLPPASSLLGFSTVVPL